MLKFTQKQRRQWRCVCVCVGKRWKVGVCVFVGVCACAICCYNFHWVAFCTAFLSFDLFSTTYTFEHCVTFLPHGNWELSARRVRRVAAAVAAAFSIIDGRRGIAMPDGPIVLDLWMKWVTRGRGRENMNERRNCRIDFHNLNLSHKLRLSELTYLAWVGEKVGIYFYLTGT